MIDLSNNNGVRPDFHRLKLSGQLRVYLKHSEDPGFLDPTYSPRASSAIAAGLRVGAYAFAHPLAVTPAESFRLLLRALDRPNHAHGLRPALDLEHGTPSRKAGLWALEWSALCRRELGYLPLVYGNAPYLSALELAREPGPLWLAAYGRDDGKEHPFVLPKPWRYVAAHQFADVARMPGIDGRCDLSHVYRPTLVDVPRLARIRRALP
jgi:GH25 family lysozyme M1 (1,4-beta-N-acetylmuramidase)